MQHLGSNTGNICSSGIVNFIIAIDPKQVGAHTWHTDEIRHTIH